MQVADVRVRPCSFLFPRFFLSRVSQARLRTGLTSNCPFSIRKSVKEAFSLSADVRKKKKRGVCVCCSFSILGGFDTVIYAKLDKCVCTVRKDITVKLVLMHAFMPAVRVVSAVLL